MKTIFKRILIALGEIQTKMKQIITFQNSDEDSQGSEYDSNCIPFMCVVWRKEENTNKRNVRQLFHATPFTGADKANIKVKFCFYFHAIFRRCRQ